MFVTFVRNLIVKQEADLEFVITISRLGCPSLFFGGRRIDALDARGSKNTPGISAPDRYQPRGPLVEVQLGNPDRLHGGQSIGAAQFRRRGRQLTVQGPFEEQG